MKLLSNAFKLFYNLGYIGNGILFLYVEWLMIKHNWINIFNPFLHIQAIIMLLTSWLFWVIFIWTVVFYFAVHGVEKALDEEKSKGGMST